MTRLPRRRSPYKQLVLFLDIAQQRPDHWTNKIGDFFEEATAKIMHGHRYDTDSGCEYCPDVSNGGTRFYESKASGRCNRVIVYEGRIEREMEWCGRNDASITYCLWRHKLWTRTVSTEQELRNALIKSTYELVTISIQQLFRVAQTIPVKCINRTNTRGWTHGWHIPIHLLLSENQTVRVQKQLTLFGQKIRNLTVRDIPEQLTLPTPLNNDPF